MNIKQAKEYIKNSVNLYLKKDEFGDYRISVECQRPIFLLGAPGIGKTAIMQQIAQELGIALVSYSMTHHTRQSALGLPFITQKIYGGKEYSVSEYTMSEIIASIYDTIEESKIQEGILFLDEINCVSETLAPSMLQFLQYKVFGRHKVPEGWIIVTAGNPPEYNKSVREFDVVTLDRLKVLEVEPEYSVWKEYALEYGVHNAILNYLDLKKEHFYHMEMTTKGRSYVTARGWEDLSEILYLYEEEGLQIDEALIGQYLHNSRIVKEFAAYYDLYQKYKKDYRIEEILLGQVSDTVIIRAKEAAFDERLSLLGMLLDKVQADIKDILEQADYLSELCKFLKGMKKVLELEKEKQEEIKEEVLLLLEKQITARKKLIEAKQRANSLSDMEYRCCRRIISFLEETKKTLFISDKKEGIEAFGLIENRYKVQVAQMQQETQKVSQELHFLFAFAEQAFKDGNEILILVTELTVNSFSARFLATFGCPDYQHYNQELMLSERQDNMQKQIAELELGEIE